MLPATRPPEDTGRTLTTVRALRMRGYRVLIVWECALRSSQRRREVLDRLNRLLRRRKSSCQKTTAGRGSK